MAESLKRRWAELHPHAIAPGVAGAGEEFALVDVAGDLARDQAAAAKLALDRRHIRVGAGGSHLAGNLPNAIVAEHRRPSPLNLLFINDGSFPRFRGTRPLVAINAR